MVRARPLSPEERREALVAATVPLLYMHGRAVTTRLIAEAAGVAEGTIFRVFNSKEELIDAALARAFRPGNALERVREIDPTLPLRDRLVRLTSIIQQRLRAIFSLMRSCGLVGPPDRIVENAGLHEQFVALHASMLAVIEPDADQLRTTPTETLHLLRMLTFASSHEEISDGHLLTPDQIVGVVLDGVLARET